MALAGVEAADEPAVDRARDLAKRLGVPFLQEPPASKEGVKLRVGASGLALAFVDGSRGKPFVLDFLTNSWRMRLKTPPVRSHIFRRALGVREEPLNIFDATAGFGQDALQALSLGCRVTAVERHPVVAMLLEDAIERARSEEDSWRPLFERLTLMVGESAEILAGLSGEAAPDVVYIDPMFDKPKKTAKSPKEMQLLQELLGPPPSMAEHEKLLAVAWAKVRQRLVIKCPLKARALRPSPTHSFKGQSIRYDVYVK